MPVMPRNAGCDSGPFDDRCLRRRRERGRNPVFEGRPLRGRCPQENSRIAHEAATTGSVRKTKTVSKTSTCKAGSRSDNTGQRHAAAKRRCIVVLVVLFCLPSSPRFNHRAGNDFICIAFICAVLRSTDHRTSAKKDNDNNLMKLRRCLTN